MKIKRRRFLKQTVTAGAMAMGAGAFLNACGRSITRADLKLNNNNFKAIPGLEKQGRAILYHASLAPSGHNIQPWYVKIIHPNEWIIGADPKRRLPSVDPNNREVLLSLGSFAENLSLTAGTFGLKARLEVIANDPFENDIMKVTLQESKQDNYPLKRITKRMTVKHGFMSKEIKGDDVRVLSVPLNGRLFYFPNGTDHANCIREGAIETFRAQFNRDEAQKEMCRWIRLTNKDARHYRDGLTIEGMEIRGFKGWFVRNFADPEDFMKASFRKQGIEKTAKQAGQGGGWLIITSKGKTVADLIETGRRFERMVLMARERMIAIHPMTQYIEEQTGMDQIAANHGSDVIPQFILRVGYLKSYPEPVSLRRPVDWFVRT